VKPNVGGSGAGITSYESREALSDAKVELGVDGTALVQEQLPAEGDAIVRIEILDSTGEPTFYDVNALSNFVANAPEVVGFDPFVQLVDLIVDRADATSERRRDPVGVPAGLA
jgi:hypothetical protein